MSPIHIAPAYEPVEVDLWGELHKTRPVTRSVEKALTAENDKLQAALEKGAATDVQVKHLAKLIGLRLERTEQAAVLIEKKWKADELSVEQLDAFIERVAEADRPT